MISQQDLYREQVEQLKDYALFFIDVNGTIRTWNAGVEHLLGYSAAEWLDQHTSLIFSPADQAFELCEAEMRTAREYGTSSDIRWHRKKDGTTIFANGVLSAVYDAANQLQGYTKIMSDETERKRLEVSLLQANAALENFAYAASHDLQEPLRTMGSYAQLVIRQEGDRLSAKGSEYLSFIGKSASQMSALIQDLLAYARAGIGQEPAISVSLDEEVEAACSQLGAAIEEASAIVTHDPLPVVTGEHSQITRLFLNLIGNAIKYRSPDRVPVIHISAATADDGHWTTVSISDNGIGFPKEYAQRMFDPFTRLHGKEHPGSGVGLTICRRIVERWGGRIWAESKNGGGAAFYFNAPLTREA